MSSQEKEEIDEWEKAHEDCNPKGCKLYGTVYCQTGCTLRWEWGDEEADDEEMQEQLNGYNHSRGL